jgi:GT2 family glycosyltransferase
MTTPRSDISLVVCSHRVERWPWLVECLESLKQQSLPPLEVIVVVDGDDRIRQRLLERDGDETVLSTPAPSGLSIARNIGIAASRGEYVAFLDDDAIADRDWLLHLRNVVDGGAVVGASGLSQPLWEGGQPEWMPQELLWALGCTYEGLPTQRTEVRNVFGGCALFERRLFEEFGGFNPNLGRGHKGLAGCEETEFCVRVRRGESHLKFVHEPAAVIHHRVPRDRQSKRYVLRRAVGEGESKAVFRQASNGFAGPLGRERAYVVTTVRRGLLRELPAILRGDRQSITRAALMLATVALTTAAFASTTAQLRVSEHQLGSALVYGFEPIPHRRTARDDIPA